VDEGTHAFYLGKELMKAKLAITLGKTYRQEGSLNWGYLTPPDEVKSEHVKLTQRSRRARTARAARIQGEAGAVGGGREAEAARGAPPKAQDDAASTPPRNPSLATDAQTPD
jgi:hypothetical protein